MGFRVSMSDSVQCVGFDTLRTAVFPTREEADQAAALVNGTCSSPLPAVRLVYAEVVETDDAPNTTFAAWYRLAAVTLDEQQRVSRRMFILATEQTPPEGLEVLVTADGWMRTGYYSERNGWTLAKFTWDSDTARPPTHWMELPWHLPRQ